MSDLTREELDELGATGFDTYHQLDDSPGWDEQSDDRRWWWRQVAAAIVAKHEERQAPPISTWQRQRRTGRTVRVA